ncbi:MAG: hypothetical protein ACQETA_08885 [Bacteroidota bacterium]
MKKLIFIKLLFIILFPYDAKGQAELLPIDSLYLAGLEKFYSDAEAGRKHIWPGMELAPVCLYRVNGPAFLYNHPDPPDSFSKINEKIYLGSQADQQLLGSTMTEINGHLSAIADYGHEGHLTRDEVYAVLFHELHHVYQQNYVKHLESDNPATLLVYPENAENDAIKLHEQRLLYRMAFTDDNDEFRNLLNSFYTCRIEREKIIGSKFMEYEKAVENLEGPAFYCELRFYNDYAGSDSLQKGIYNCNHFWDILNTPFYGRTKLRMRHLASGMAMCYILDRYHPGWKKEFYGGSTYLSDFFISKLDAEKLELEYPDSFLSLSTYHTHKLIEKHRRNFESFNTHAGVEIVMEFESSPQFRGFDPMNAEAINDSTVLHTTLLSLGKNDNSLFFANYDAVTIDRGQIWFVKKLRFFLEDISDLKLNDDKVNISTDGVEISWTGEITNREQDRIIIRCR